MGQPRFWTVEKVAHLQSLLKQSLTVEQIAEELGACIGSLRTFASRANVRLPRKIKSPPEVWSDRHKFKEWVFKERISPRTVSTFTGCLEWSGATDRNNYGQVRVVQRPGEPCRMYYTHRVALEFKLGRDLQSGEYSLHTCDNSLCCNPDHLFVGNQSSNIRDMMNKGRGGGQFKPGHRNTYESQIRGERCANAILTDELVRQIRAMYVPGVYGYKRIARSLGLHHATVYGVTSGKRWSHVK